ncbi:MAG: ATP-binding protein [Polyangiaceae bacterium]|jgi:PAS domain S-box-containing protein
MNAHTNGSIRAFLIMSATFHRFNHERMPAPHGCPLRPLSVKSFAQWLARVPPVNDPADAISASLVAHTIDVLVVAVLLFGLGAALAGRLTALYALTLPVALAILVALRAILNRGHVRRAAYALCTAGWLLVAIDLQQHGEDTIAVGGFVVLIVIGGLTLGLLGAVALSLATTALLAPFLLGAIHGTFSIPTGRDRFVHYTTQLVLAGAVAGWWALRTRRLMTDLRRSEARRSLLLEASPDAIVSSDALGTMTFLNRATEQMLGYAASETVGRRWSDLQHVFGADFVRLMVGLTLTPSSGDHAPPEELTLIHRDGHSVVVDVKGMPLYEDGQIVGVVAILRDITSRKKAETERASLQRQLAMAQRMEAVGRVAGGVAHDFNNLLTIILAAAETGDPQAIEDIGEAARRGVALTRQLLAFGGAKHSDPRPIDVNRAIAAIRPMLGRVLGTDVNLEIRLTPETAPVVIDPAQLDQVLVNLAANARDAMPDGGMLTVSTQLNGDRVELHVADTGVGMAPATLASAFEPFFTTKGDGGTGLGLAVVQNIVQGVGGTIASTSVPGRGTSFTFSFPVSSELPFVPPVVRRAAVRAARRAVFVDDNSFLRQVVVRALERAGFVVDAFEGGCDLPAIEAQLAGADVLITDLVMPGTSGVDLALELRRRNCQVPILFVSGYAEHALLKRVREVSRSSILPKPFTAQDVAERLGELQDGQPAA